MNGLQRPVAAVQGLWLRSTIKFAPPATGPTHGTIGTTSRPALRIAVLGDSTAAGCGVPTHEDGFTGSLAREFAARTQRPVEWQVAGQFGATARRIRYRLLPRVGADLDVAVLLAGANDVMSGRSPDEWLDDLAAIVDELIERADRVVIAGVPPFARFPAIPPTLGRRLGERAAVLDEVSQRICAVRPCTTWVTMTEAPPRSTSRRTASTCLPPVTGDGRRSSRIVWRCNPGRTTMDVFGSVADLYETARPSYPPALADVILAYCGRVPASVVDVGAGTGKGTEVLAAIGAPPFFEPGLSGLLRRTVDKGTLRFTAPRPSARGPAPRLAGWPSLPRRRGPPTGWPACSP